MTTIVLYHAHCADGFGAAYAAWLALGDQDVIYLPVSYGDPLPDVLDCDRVFILDFSYPREVLLKLKETVSELVVIDHHKTAAADLAGLPFAIFDLSHSGAVLAWNYFRGQGSCFGEVPTLLLYVEDRDLWNWHLPQSREFSAGLALYPRDFLEWGLLDCNEGSHKLRREGAIALRYQKQLVDSIADRFYLAWMRVDAVPVCNTPILQSEVGEELLRRHPDRPFVACYWESPRPDGMLRRWSLRSRPGGTDVAEIARAVGGGGHPNAAGFEQLMPFPSYV